MIDPKKIDWDSLSPAHAYVLGTQVSDERAEQLIEVRSRIPATHMTQPDAETVDIDGEL